MIVTISKGREVMPTAEGGTIPVVQSDIESSMERRQEAMPETWMMLDGQCCVCIVCVSYVYRLCMVEIKVAGSSKSCW